jgi:hypothetical protein
MTTAAVGRHSELLAITALLANGYTVLEPAVPEPFDLAITKRSEKTIIRAQVKTALFREKDGIEYYVVKGKKNSGIVYDMDDCDVFIGVIGNDVYMFDNTEITEYWVRADAIEGKWTRLTTRLEHSQSA